MFDTIIREGTVIDGSGHKKFKADVGLKDGKIKRLGDLTRAQARNGISARGCYVTPGFIDIHSHSDTHWTLFKYPRQDSLIRQGITTIIGGNCGSSLAPLLGPEAIKGIQKWTDLDEVNVSWNNLGEFLSVLEKSPLALNFGTLVGHGTMRRGLLSDQTRDLKEEEQAIFNKTLKESLKQGAYGLSVGLGFCHACYVKTGELIALAEILAKHSAVLAVHLRSEGRGILQAVTEAIDIARTSGVSLEISHFKFEGKESWPAFDKTIDLVEKTAKEGGGINFDVYPYSRTGSVLYAYLPGWVIEGGQAKMLKRLRDRSLRKEILADMKKDEHDYASLRLAYTDSFNASIGRTIKTVAAEQGVSPEEAVINVLIAVSGRMIVFGRTGKEENIARLIQHPLSLVASDGFGLNLAGEAQTDLTHPRSFGTFPKILASYVRARQALRWEEAVAKMTGQPAAKFGIRDRGLVKEGFAADIAIFDPKTVTDLSSYEKPYRYAQGIKHVLVNGEPVVAESQVTGRLPGAVLRK